MQDVRRAAVIGLGSMGWGAALSLLRADFSVAGCDVRTDVLQRFAEAGGKPCTTPAKAAEATEAILIFVVNSKQAEDVLFGSQGALETAVPGTVFLLCTTMAPSAAISIAERLEAVGMLVIDAPVSGGHLKALSGLWVRVPTKLSSGLRLHSRPFQPRFSGWATGPAPARRSR
ncbi:NAD(P)-dependent oxidoreductase [Neorhizobium sp. DT-125]|uniref:NAD(P)-dependent oxidoreductase n=1 Tax=Neorhizobium sp. DT-125 TaxID=3396163 RepID=UPI003F1CDB79